MAYTTKFIENGVDVGTAYISKEYMMEIYPSLIPSSKMPGLWACGYNLTGELGHGDVYHYSSPVQVGSLTNWKQAAFGGGAASAIKTDGSIWAWGNNGNGGLGLGDSGFGTNRSSPAQVGILTNWAITDCGYGHTAAIKTNGSLWTWGYDAYGQLGIGDNYSYSSPVQVGTLTNWSHIVCGDSHTVAIKTDGSLWTWGYNISGQLGQADVVHRSSPVQVGALTNWTQISAGRNHIAAIKTDGTLWTWGDNYYGQLGLDTNTNSYSSPVQVGALTDWSYVASGDNHIAAIKIDGTLWACGYNFYGQLGVNDVVHRSSPVQVGALTNWKRISCGANHIAAIKTDGTVWVCGQNSNGQLGLDDISHRSSPVQVGSLTNWKQIACGYQTTAFIKEYEDF